MKKNLAYKTISSAILAISKWLIIVIVAKYGGLIDVGIYTLGFAIAAPIITFAEMQHKQVYVSGISCIRLNQLYRIRFALLFVGFIFCILLGYTLGYNNDVMFVIALVTMDKFLFSMNEIVRSSYQKEKNFKCDSFIEIIENVAKTILFVITYLYTRSLLFAITLSCLVSFLVHIYIYKLVEIDGFKLLNLKQALMFIRKTIYLAIVITIVSLMTNSIRIIINESYGQELLGAFASLFYFITAGNLFIITINQVANPYLGDIKKNDDVQFVKRILVYSLYIGLILAVAVGVISYYQGSSIVIMIYGIEMEPYAQYIIYFALIWVLILMHGFYRQICTSFGIYKNQVLPLLIGLIILISVFLIYSHDDLFFNAFISYIVAYGFINTYLLIVIWKDIQQWQKKNSTNIKH